MKTEKIIIIDWNHHTNGYCNWNLHAVNSFNIWLVCLPIYLNLLRLFQSEFAHRFLHFVTLELQRRINVVFYVIINIILWCLSNVFRIPTWFSWFFQEEDRCSLFPSPSGRPCGSQEKSSRSRERTPVAKAASTESGSIRTYGQRGTCWRVTLPETNELPLKNCGLETTFLLGRPIFRWYVSFREGSGCWWMLLRKELCGP